MRAATLTIVDLSGQLSPASGRELFHELRGGLNETRRYAVPEPGTDAPSVAARFVARLAKGPDPLTGGPAWTLTLARLDDGGAEAESYSMRCSEQLLLCGLARDLAHRFAAPDDYPELARAAGAVGSVQHPKVQARDPGFLLPMLVAALSNGEWEAAIAHADTLLEVQPGNLGPLYAKAVALRRLDRPEEALLALARLLARGPDAQALALRGALLLGLGREDEASAAFASAAESAPEDPVPAALLGCLDSYRRATPMLFVRIGWIGCMLRMAPFLRSLHPGARAALEAALSDLDAALRGATGGGLGVWGGEEALAGCRASLESGELADYQARSRALDAAFRERVASDFPPRAAQWVDWGTQLNWHQFIFATLRRGLAGGDADARAGAGKFEASFRELTGAMGADERFLAGCPELAPVVRELGAAAARGLDLGKLDAIHAGITRFAERLPLPE